MELCHSPRFFLSAEGNAHAELGPWIKFWSICRAACGAPDALSQGESGLALRPHNWCSAVDAGDAAPFAWAQQGVAAVIGAGGQVHGL